MFGKKSNFLAKNLNFRENFDKNSISKISTKIQFRKFRQKFNFENFENFDKNSNSRPSAAKTILNSNYTAQFFWHMSCNIRHRTPTELFCPLCKFSDTGDGFFPKVCCRETRGLNSLPGYYQLLEENYFRFFKYSTIYFQQFFQIFNNFFFNKPNINAKKLMQFSVKLQFWKKYFFDFSPF